MAADYGLLGGGFSVANALAALGAGQQQRIQQQQLGLQQQRFQREEAELARQEQIRSGLQGAYDPTTGSIDPVAARTAYARAGDVQGAMAFDKSRADQQAAQYKAALDQATSTAQLLNGVTDETSYQRARQVAQSQGLDVSKVPAQFDPQWVQTMRDQALTVQQKLTAERDRWVPIGERGLLNVSDPASVQAYLRDQRNGKFNSGGAAEQPVRVTSPEQLRNLAPGTQFIAPDGSVRRVPGGAPSQGGATFP